MMNSRKRRRELQRAHNIHWQDVYQLPLHLDHHGSYAWSANDTIALDFKYGNTEEEYKQMLEFAKKVVDCINGVKPLELPLNWGVYNGIDFCYNGKYVFCVRGWGHLTGTGALHLPEKEAARIQDEFVKYILEKLAGK